uniref:Altered inheritance of mitochondria protein 32 n=1 Tax=Lygus hesperus TaxID=30085 RepID=A0A0A9W166_LYGHE
MLRNAAFRVVEPALLKYSTLHESFTQHSVAIIHNSTERGANICSSQSMTSNCAVGVDTLLPFAALQSLYTMSSKDKQSLLNVLTLREKRLWVTLTNNDAIRKHYNALDHLYTIIGEESALPTAHQMLHTSYLSPSPSQTPLSSSSQNAFAVKHNQHSEAMVVTVIESFRLFAIHAILLHHDV